jgi:hypothetical protein
MRAEAVRTNDSGAGQPAFAAGLENRLLDDPRLVLQDPWSAQLNLCVPITSATWADAARLAVSSVPRLVPGSPVPTWPGVR